MKLKYLALAGSLLLVAAAAHADTFFHFNSSNGPMELRVGPRGEVEGHYEREPGSDRPGTLVGQMQPDGTIDGIWFQETTTHPCSDMREGTDSWGRFKIADAWSPRPYGVWGHCTEVPERSWNLHRR